MSDEVHEHQRGGGTRWVALAGIAALAVIVAVVGFPRLAAKREKARPTSCLSNVKQLALATQMYAAEHDQSLPDARTWHDALLPYTKSTLACRCPDDSSPAMPGAFPVSYGMNVGLSRRQLKTVAGPAETPSLYDAATIYGDETIAVFRHNDGLSVAFSDGHAKWIERAQWGTVWSAGVSSLAPAASAPTNSGGAP